MLWPVQRSGHRLEHSHWPEIDRQSMRFRLEPSAVHWFQWLFPRVHGQGATSLVIADPAVNTNSVVSRRTTLKRPPHVPKPRHRRPRHRRTRTRWLPHELQSLKPTSPGRRPRLAASSRACERHEKSAAADARSSSLETIRWWLSFSGLPNRITVNRCTHGPAQRRSPARATTHRACRRRWRRGCGRSFR